MSTKPLVQALVLGSILLANLTCALAQEQSTAGQQAITPEKRALIAELLEVTDSKKNALAFYNAMLDQQQNQMPDVIWQSLAGKKEFQGLSSDEKAQLRKRMLETSTLTNKRLRESSKIFLMINTASISLRVRSRIWLSSTGRRPAKRALSCRQKCLPSR
jgi:hypothetical protein